jgi:hypothetical protein
MGEQEKLLCQCILGKRKSALYMFRRVLVRACTNSAESFLLAEHRQSRGEVVLKGVNSNLVTADEFYR